MLHLHGVALGLFSVVEKFGLDSDGRKIEVFGVVGHEYVA